MGDDAELPKQLTQAMMDESEIGGCIVTAVSMEDEIIKAERLEEQTDNCICWGYYEKYNEQR